MLLIKQRTRSRSCSPGAEMLPIAAMICAFCLGEFFFARSQYLTGLLAFLTASIGGVIVGCYLEAIAGALLKKLFVKTRTRAAIPSQSRTRKPQPATSNNPT